MYHVLHFLIYLGRYVKMRSRLITRTEEDTGGLHRTLYRTRECRIREDGTDMKRDGGTWSPSGDISMRHRRDGREEGKRLKL